MELAPIILFVYNRPWHTKQTLVALQKNELADQSILYIYADGLKDGSSPESDKAVKETRAVLFEEKWCKEVYVIERDSNFGLAANVIDGVTSVVNQYGKVIVLEDDILTSTHFLQYMNDGLSVYKTDKNVYGISGYKYPCDLTLKNETFFLPIASSWSYATWDHVWNKINFDSKKLLEIIDEKKLKVKMNFGGISFYEMLVDQIKGKNDSWAIRFYASIFLKNGFFLYPKYSLVENIGFDNSGIHCKPEDFFSNVKLNNHRIIVKKKDDYTDKKVIKAYKKTFENNFKKASNKTTYKFSKYLKSIIKKVNLIK